MKKQVLILFIGVLMVAFCSCKSKENKVVTFGIISDVHEDLQDDATQRLQTFIDEATIASPDFIIQLGDLCHSDGANKILPIWNSYQGDKFSVFGNHDMDHASKEKMIELYKMPAGHYYFDKEGVRFLVMDCAYTRKNGELVDYNNGNYFVDAKDRDLVSPEQLVWMKQVVSESDYPCVIFSHQAFDEIGGSVPNRSDFRALVKELNKDKKRVIASICGHHHIDAHSVIDGVDYIHINSASYLWIEGEPKYSKGNMAEYKDPIYAFITIDTNNKSITIAGKQSQFKEPAPVEADFKAEDFQHYKAAISNRTIHY